MSVQEIVDEFYTTRRDIYQTRKDYQLRRLQYELDLLAEKIRFINGVVDETIQIHRKSRKEIDAQLEEQKFRKFPSGRFDLDTWFTQQSLVAENPEYTSPNLITADYQYLVSMPIYNLTSDKIIELESVLQERQSQLDTLKGLTPEMIWKTELDEFEKVYNQQMEVWTKEQEQEYLQNQTKGKTKAKRPRKVIKKK